MDRPRSDLDGLGDFLGRRQRRECTNDRLELLTGSCGIQRMMRRQAHGGKLVQAGEFTSVYFCNLLTASYLRDPLLKVV